MRPGCRVVRVGAAQHAPVFRALRRPRRFGRARHSHGRRLPRRSVLPIQGTYPSKWRADVTQAGGGCLIEHSIHDVDILRFCFGDVAAVAARTANVAGHEGVEDLASVSVSFASGFEAQLTSVWHDIHHGSTRRVEVFCSRGDGLARRRVPWAAACADERGERCAPLSLPRVGRRAPSGQRRCRSGPPGLRRGRPRLRRGPRWPGSPRTGLGRGAGRPPPGRRRLPFCGSGGHAGRDAPSGKSSSVMATDVSILYPRRSLAAAQATPGVLPALAVDGSAERGQTVRLSEYHTHLPRRSPCTSPASPGPSGGGETVGWLLPSGSTKSHTQTSPPGGARPGC